MTSCLILPLSAQNNGIFNGGFGTGYAFALMSQLENNSIFQGSMKDGYDAIVYAQETNFDIFAGGTGDGYSFNFGSKISNGNIFGGGSDDGYAYNFQSIENQNMIFAGGTADGYDIAFGDVASANAIFAGGIDDGYHTSGISKLIWTGQQSSDWLMADNWNVQRTPLARDYVLIPEVETTYPLLTGKLLVGHLGSHTYTCQSMRILSSANVTGDSEAWLENYGLIEIRGLLEFLNQGNNLNKNLGEGIIYVYNFGQFNLLQ